MLAQLDEIHGVSESRVDWTGRRFLLALEAGASESKVADEAMQTLGEGTLVLDAGETATAVDGLAHGEAWMRGGETIRLSHYEAHVLAQRRGGEVAADLGLTEDATRKLVALFETELDRAFERAHDGGRGAPSRAELESAVERTLDSSRAFLNSEQQAALEELLHRFAAARGG